MPHPRKSKPNARGQVEKRSERLTFAMTPTIKTRLGKVRAAMAKNVPAPVEVSLNDTLTVAVTRGLDLIEKELKVA